MPHHMGGSACKLSVEFVPCRAWRPPTPARPTKPCFPCYTTPQVCAVLDWDELWAPVSSLRQVPPSMSAVGNFDHIRPPCPTPCTSAPLACTLMLRIVVQQRKYEVLVSGPGDARISLSWDDKSECRTATSSTNERCRRAARLSCISSKRSRLYRMVRSSE